MASNIGRWGNCQHCGGAKPCKPCTLARQQRWAEEKKDRVNAQKQAYAQRFPDRVAKSKSDNYQRHGATYAKRAKERRAADPEARRQQDRDSYSKNPRPFITRNERRDERDRLVGGKFTVADKCILFSEQSGLCANPFCEADLSVSGFHADHKLPVLLGGSHDRENRQLLCPTCNHRKGAKTNEEWLKSQERKTA